VLLLFKNYGMDKLMRSKKSEYYLDFLNEGSKDGYTFEYFSEEIREGDDKICLKLNIDCEVYVLGELCLDEIIEELNNSGGYNGFGFDLQSVRIYIVNKDKFFDKYVVPLKKVLKESPFGKYIRAVNFYRKKGSEIYPPEVSISIKPNVKFMSEEWFKISIELMSWIMNYKREEGLNNLEFITPMSSMNDYVFNN
jgi:hypothetical protein